MKISIVSIKDGFINLWKELLRSRPIQNKITEIPIKSQDEAMQKKIEVENVLKEHRLDRVQVEFVYCQNKGAEFTLRGKILATKELMQEYKHAMEEISKIGLKFFYSQEFNGGELVLNPLYPYGFGKQVVFS